MGEQVGDVGGLLPAGGHEDGVEGFGRAALTGGVSGEFA